MRLLQPAGLAALALLIPIVILHMLTPRRPTTPVSSLLHWEGLKHSITAAEPWQRLRWSLLFILQLLAAILIALALANPALVEEAELADHTVFIIDASASMAAIDGSPDRLAAALALADTMRGQMPDSGIASVVVANSQPVVLLSQSDDLNEFRRAVLTIRSSGSGVDYEAAFALAESLVTPDRPTGFVLLSDGQLDDIEQRLAPLGTRYVPVGVTDTNRAITDLSVVAGPGGLQARVTIQSTGGPSATQVLRLDVDGVTVLTETIEIPSGEVVEHTFELPPGVRVAAYLDGEDLLAADNQRYASAPVLGDLKARIHGEAIFFVEQLLAAMPGVEVVSGEVGSGEEVDFEIFVGVAVPEGQTTPFIAIDVPGGLPGVTPLGRVDNPIPTLVANDPIFDDVDVSQIAIASAQLLHVERGNVLLASPGAPLLVSGDLEGVPFYYLAFTLEESNLPVTIAYPILGARMVGGLASAQGVLNPIVVGDRVALDANTVAIVDPRGARTQVSAESSPPVANQSGFWVIETADGGRADLAVNLDTSESDLAPRSELSQLRPALPTQDPTVATVSRSILPWILVAILVVLAVELAVSLRARGVSKRQWTWGMVTRGAIVLLLVLSLVDPAFSTRSGAVTTVFVVDVSASVGASDRASRAWVESAVLAGEGDWAVVEFGADARVATPIGDPFYRPARGIDREATSIARALRLGESVLTGETRQRLVLISDGRANTGDLQAELDRLRALGIAVDVHTISGETRSDAAVSGIDVPNTVNEGEAFTAVVEVISTINATAEVDLMVGSERLDSRTVQLQPGTNQVPFQVTAGASGIQQLEARVRMAGDTVTANDMARTGVEVLGPASVLIVEGNPGNGEVLEHALSSTGLVVVRLGIDDLPDLQELAIHRAVLLVDVRARDLNPTKMQSLETLTRDLGRGLVVVGGTNSFGVGGYRDTPIEALLPVDSEATDPTREVNVAEVLLIDTSESMGACHCADDGTGEFVEGGVNKTDISKAAAIKAIEALGPNDEVGVLAFSGTSRWAVPLQQNPERSTIDTGVGSLRPFGETRVIPALRQAAEALRGSDKELKHIILFTDGFTSELDQGEDFGSAPDAGRQLLAEVERLAEEGITVSVVGTGEGAITSLEDLAIAGRGRFYPGRDLNEIPEIFVKESRLASRTFINEGEFFPVVTSTSAAVRDLASSPALLGYLAATAKPTADVQLRVGALNDPLLSSWRVGLGTVTAWTSDGGEKWSSLWASWDGFANFWSNLVRDSFPLSGAEGERVTARISEGQMRISLESAQSWPAGTSPVARIGMPDGTSQQVRLERISDNEFAAVVSARQGGTYAVGVSFEGSGDDPVVLSAIATRSFAAEYLPGPSDQDLMSSISLSTGGRGEITADQAFDAEGLEPGISNQSFKWWFLLLAALLWPLDVALRRLRLSRREGQLRTAPATPATPTTPSV